MMVKLNPFSHPNQGSGAGSFLPEDYVSRKADGRANILCLGLFTIVMAGVVSAFMVTNRQWEDVKREQEAINVSYEQESKKISQLKDLESQRTSMIERGEITTALIERTPRSILMAEVVTRLPEGITILNADVKSKRLAVVLPTPAQPAAQTRSISGSRASKSKSKSSAKSEPPPPPKPQAPRFESMLSLTGVAVENQQIADYLAALKQCELLESVELAYIKESIMADMSLRRFQIDAKLRVLTSTPARVASTPVTDGTPSATVENAAVSQASMTATTEVMPQATSGTHGLTSGISKTASAQPSGEE